MIALRYHLDVIPYFANSLIHSPHTLATLTENKLDEAIPADVFQAIKALPSTERNFSLSSNVLKDPEFGQRLQEGLFPIVYAEGARCRYLFPSEELHGQEKIVFSGRVLLGCSQ